MILIGTSGSRDYLNDQTGSRRFWLRGRQQACPRVVQIQDRLRADPEVRALVERQRGDLLVLRRP